ncbi:MAG: adenylate/guanylate cyclase domain-containing protein [Rhodobacterales bacterium]|nr:adenylate/guanylate cyclase domain-containing protein [Rhodobacterales bacterium]
MREGSADPAAPPQDIYTSLSRKELQEQIRGAIREYLRGVDSRGDKLAQMLAASRTLSDNHLASTSDTEQSILYSDFVGSCTMFHELGDTAAHELMQEYFEISKVTISRFDGKIIKFTGDGVLSLFPTTTRALKASLFARNLFEMHNKRFPLLPITVRMGLNVGEVIEDEIDAYGTSINLSARLCDASQPGKVLCSNIVRLRNIDQGFRFDPHSEIFAKGFPRPIKTHFLYDRRSINRVVDFPLNRENATEG